MTTETTPEATPAAAGDIVPRPVHGDVIEAYENLIAQVPDAGQEGIESILRQLAAVVDPNQLDAPWAGGGLGEYRDRPIVVLGIRKMPSEYAGPLPWFLIVDGQDPATGADLHLTTGAVSVVAQLVKAYTAGWLPMTVIPRQSERPTADGYYPQHLEVHR